MALFMGTQFITAIKIPKMTTSSELQNMFGPSQGPQPLLWYTIQLGNLTSLHHILCQGSLKPPETVEVCALAMIPLGCA